MSDKENTKNQEVETAHRTNESELNAVLSALLHACEYIQDSLGCPADMSLVNHEKYNCALKCVHDKEHLCWKDYFMSLGGR